MSGVISGVTFSGQHRLLELDGRRAAGRRFLVRNFRALLDHGFLLVGGDDARRGNHFALAFGLCGRKLEVDDVVRAQHHQRQAAGRIGDRQVHVVAIGSRATRGHLHRKRPATCGEIVQRGAEDGVVARGRAGGGVQAVVAVAR